MWSTKLTEESKSPIVLQVNSKVLTDWVLESSGCPDNANDMSHTKRLLRCTHWVVYLTHALHMDYLTNTSEPFQLYKDAKQLKEKGDIERYELTHLGRSKFLPRKKGLNDYL